MWHGVEYTSLLQWLSFLRLQLPSELRHKVDWNFNEIFKASEKIMNDVIKIAIMV